MSNNDNQWSSPDGNQGPGQGPNTWSGQGSGQGNPGGASGTADARSADTFRFPWVRLLYSVGFGVIGWFVFWLIVLLAVLQYVVTAINREKSGDLNEFNANLVQYLWEVMSFVALTRDERPFPLGPFPKTNQPPANVQT